MANQWRGEHDEPATPRDFMPWLEDESAEEEPQAHVGAMVEMLKRVFGAREVEDSQADAAVSQETL